MYTDYYGLREKPFSLTPDPRFLYLSASHREALAHLVYGIDRGEGFIAVTGEVGTGKTTLSRTLLDRLGPQIDLALLFNPPASGEDLLREVNRELGLPFRARSRAELSAELNRFLLEAHLEGRRVLLLVDEAQNLPPETLEEIRLLSNLETETSKLIHIVLFGQPELDSVLDSAALRQLRQRISVRWRLEPLTGAEVGDYVRHRVRVASGSDRGLFSDGALRELGRRSKGVPRLVNLVADRALLAGYAAGAPQIERRQVALAAREIFSTRRGRGPRRVLGIRFSGPSTTGTEGSR